MNGSTGRGRGLFVAFEGGEGAGKSTQAKLLIEALGELGHQVVHTREPGGTDLGLRIREILLAPDAEPVAKAEALLFAADRAQHAHEVIRPALTRGCVVVSDRYLLSSIAYQGIARGLGAEKIAQISDWATDDLAPDLTILLQVDPEVGLARANERNRMESEPEQFHVQVAQGFAQYASEHPDKIIVLDAREEVQVIAEQILKAVLARL